MKRALLGLIFLMPMVLQAQLTVEQIDAAVMNRKADKTFVSQLIRALGDGEEGIQVRERAAWALGELNVKSSVDALLKAVTHKGLLIRSAALDSLIRLRATAALPALINIAKTDPILTLRQKATLGLGLIKSDKAIEPLVALSDDPAPEIRGASVLAMAALHSKKNDFTEILTQMSSDPNPYVQERAKRGLEIAGKKKQQIHEQLKSDDLDIRLFGAQYYHYHGATADLKMLKDAWNVEANDEIRFELDLSMKAIKKRAEEFKAQQEKERKEKDQLEKEKAGQKP